MKTVEKFESPQISLLHNILGVNAVACHPEREIIRCIEVRQDVFFKFCGSISF